MELHERLRAAREASGLSRAEAEGRAGLPKRTLERWEQGLNEPGALWLAKLAPVLGTTVEALTGSEAQPLAVTLDGLVARFGLDEVHEQVAERVAVALREKL